MALYKFKVSNPGGQVSEVLIEGDSQAEATRRLQQRNLLPLKFLGEGGEVASNRQGLSLRSRFDVVDFTDKLVPLLEAHIPLERALGIVAEGGGRGKGSTEVIDGLRKGLHEGRRFSQMLRDRGHMFPELYASLVEAGEEAGCLAEVLGDLRKFLNDRRELVSYIISASIYPVVVLAVSLVIMGILLAVVIPRFAEILQMAGGEPPLSTQILLTASVFVRGYWWTLIIAVFLGVAGIAALKRNHHAREAMDQFLVRLPVFGQFVRLSNLSRMARTMSILMSNGVHILQTVKISSRVLQNHAIRQSVANVAPELRRGEKLAQALSRSSYIPSLMLRMIAIGEETGGVDQMLGRVAERFEADLRRKIRSALSLFEPAIIVCLGLFVGLVVVTMFLTIMDLQGGL